MSGRDLFTEIAENHSTLTGDTGWHRAAQCHKPVGDRQAYLSLRSAADGLLYDIKDGMHALGDLVASHPSDIGDEATMLPRVGALIRLLANTLEFASHAAEKAEDQIWCLDRIEAVEAVEAAPPASSKPKRQATAPAE